MIECTGIPEQFARSVTERLHDAHLSMWCGYNKSQFHAHLTENRKALSQAAKEVPFEYFVFVIRYCIQVIFSLVH